MILVEWMPWPCDSPILPNSVSWWIIQDCPHNSGCQTHVRSPSSITAWRSSYIFTWIFAFVFYIYSLEYLLVNLSHYFFLLYTVLYVLLLLLLSTIAQFAPPQLVLLLLIYFCLFSLFFFYHKYNLFTKCFGCLTSMHNSPIKIILKNSECIPSFCRIVYNIAHVVENIVGTICGIWIWISDFVDPTVEEKKKDNVADRWVGWKQHRLHQFWPG